MGDKFWQGGTSIGSKSGPGGPFFLPKSVRGTTFAAKIGPAGPILGGTDFGVTGPYAYGKNTRMVWNITLGVARY